MVVRSGGMAVMTSPDELIESFQERLAEICQMVEVDVTQSGESAVSLDYVRVEPAERGQGFATLALNVLIEMCDAAEMTIFVIPTKVGDGDSLNDQSLAAWYARHGFFEAPTDELPRRMRRSPGELP